MVTQRRRNNNTSVYTILALRIYAYTMKTYKYENWFFFFNREKKPICRFWNETPSSVHIVCTIVISVLTSAKRIGWKRVMIIIPLLLLYCKKITYYRQTLRTKRVSDNFRRCDHFLILITAKYYVILCFIANQKKKFYKADVRKNQQ